MGQRRARYVDFYRTFEPRRGTIEPASRVETAAPVESFTESRKQACRQWYPTGEFVKITDSKRRDWLVYDSQGLWSFRYDRPFGDARANVRLFWFESMVRARYIDSPEDHATCLDAVRRQLRGTFRVDFPEQATRSPGAAIQDLYDSRRGMGRR